MIPILGAGVARAAQDIGEENNKNRRLSRNSIVETFGRARRESLLRAERKQHSLKLSGKRVFNEERVESATRLIARAESVYARVSFRCKALAQSNAFSSTITFCIILASILVAMQTYPTLEQNKAVLILDEIVLWVFSAECLVKIIGEGSKPYRYFTGPEWRWNTFDFVLVLFCMPFFPVGSGGVSFLRLLRLLRVTKLFKKVPQLQILVGGMIQGLKSIVYVSLLLLLVFYLFAVVAVFYFGPNDPAQFGGLGISFVTLFRCATCEDWTDVMYINMFGCDVYDGGLYTQADSNQPVYSAFGKFNGFECSAPSRHWLMSVVYFVYFITVSAFVLLSLFIGSITIGMSEALEDVNRLKNQALAESVNNAIDPTWFTHLLEKAFLDPTSNQKHAEFDPISISQALENGHEKAAPLDGLTGNLARAGSTGALLGHGGEGGSRTPPRNSSGAAAPRRRRRRRGCWRARRLWHRWSRGCRRLAEHPRFQAFMVGVILAAGVLVGLATRFENAALAALDNVVLGIFVVELVAKLSSDEERPLRFFKDSWNVFDFVVVAGSIIPMLLRLDFAGIISMLRLLRLLRVLKLVKTLPRLKILVDALMDGFGSMSYLCVLMFLVFFLFAVVGMMLFETNDPWHYGTLNSAMLSLFRISTLEDWTDIMFINQYGCDVYGWQVYPALSSCSPRAMGYWSVLYHIVFVILSSMVLVTTFLGVVITSMFKAYREQEILTELNRQAQELATAREMPISCVKTLQEAFQLFDIDHGGDIDVEEVFPLFLALCPEASDEQLADLFLAIDKDGSGAIDFDEFIELVLVLRKVNEDGLDALYDYIHSAGMAGSFPEDGENGPGVEVKTLELGVSKQDTLDGVVLGYIEVLQASVKAFEHHLQNSIKILRDDERGEEGEERQQDWQATHAIVPANSAPRTILDIGARRKTVQQPNNQAPYIDHHDSPPHHQLLSPLFAKNKKVIPIIDTIDDEYYC